MCGRYRLSRRKQLVEEYFDGVSGEEEWTPRYNIAPTAPEGASPATFSDEVGTHAIMGKRWLWCGWHDQRSETAATKPAFRESLKSRRAQRFRVGSSCSGPVESGGTSPVTLECGLMFKVASWNLNSVRSRLTHVTTWLKAREPDVLLLQELKGTEFPSGAFESLDYESVAVTQKAYNGVAILSRHPMKTIAKTLVGDDSDSHARFLEVIIKGIRIVNIYLPNGNPVGSDKFAYKLAWMDRLKQQMVLWRKDSVPTLVGGDFNVIPEDIDCHKPGFRSLHPNEVGQFTFWDYFRQAFHHNRGIRIDHFLLSPTLADRLEGCEIDKGPRAQEKPSDHTPIIVTLSALP